MRVERREPDDAARAPLHVARSFLPGREEPQAGSTKTLSIIRCRHSAVRNDARIHARKGTEPGARDVRADGRMARPEWCEGGLEPARLPTDPSHARLQFRHSRAGRW